MCPPKKSCDWISFTFTFNAQFCWQILHILFTKPGSESDQTESESHRTLVRVTEAPLGESKKQTGCTWYAPPLAQSTLLLAVLVSFELEGILWEIVQMQQLLSNPPFLLPFLSLPVSSIPIYPPPPKWKARFIKNKYTDKPPYILGFTWNAAPFATIRSFLAICLWDSSLVVFFNNNGQWVSQWQCHQYYYIDYSVHPST